MHFRSPRLWLIFVGIAFAGLAAWSLRYFSGVEPLTALSQNYAQAGLGQIGLQANDAHVIGHERGRRRWRMTARTVTFSRDRHSLTVDGIRQGILYDAREHPLFSVTAGHAVWQTPFGSLSLSNAGTLRLDGGILATVLTPDHPLLQSQAILWDSLHNQIVSPGPITAAVPRLTVTAGSGIYALPTGAMVPENVSAQNVRGRLRLSSGIRAVFQSRNGPATLACPGLDWNSTLNIARSLGPVIVQIPGGLGAATAADVQADTKTGNLQGHGFQGTLLLSTEVQ